MEGVKLADELAFYGAYHSNFENQVIHIIFVPMLLLSAFMILGLTLGRTASFLGWTAYALFYLYLDPTVGGAAAAFYFALWVLADWTVRLHTTKRGAKAVPALSKGGVWFIAIMTQVVGWGAQILIGHAMYEGRKPALFDSLVQAFSLAPLFVVYEALWMLIPGFQPELKAEVNAKIAAIHQNWTVSAK